MSDRHAETTADLFGEPALPDGFRYLPNVISAAEERDLVRRFEQLVLTPYRFHGHFGNRRIIAFGQDYLFAGQNPCADHRIPDWFGPLIEIASSISGKPAAAFEQAMVTEYAPGAGIGWHRDKPNHETIVAMSFLAPCRLRLRRPSGPSWERRSVLIEPRSVYMMHGEVRDDWQHSIVPMDVLRYSVTMRTLRQAIARPSPRAERQASA